MRAWHWVLSDASLIHSRGFTPLRPGGQGHMIVNHCDQQTQFNRWECAAPGTTPKPRHPLCHSSWDCQASFHHLPITSTNANKNLGCTMVKKKTIRIRSNEVLSIEDSNVSTATMIRGGQPVVCKYPVLEHWYQHEQKCPQAMGWDREDEWGRGHRQSDWWHV